MAFLKLGNCVRGGITAGVDALVDLCTRFPFQKLFFLILWLSVGSLRGQEVPQDTSSQNPAVNCSDPAQSSSPECANPASLPGLGAAQRGLSRTPQPRAGGNYNDLESLGGQPRSTQNQISLPPERLTEFQKFVASSTGEVLPIFGANLFRRVPSTFAPVDLAPVPPDYLVGPGDELRIRVWGQINFQSNVRVDRSGEIYIPQVGPIHVANLPLSALDGQLRSAIGRVYHNFDLTVDLGQIRSIQVYLAGEARQPGLYTVSALSSLVDALFTAGGPTAEGSLRAVQLRRGGKTIAQFDLYSLIIHGDTSNDVKLFSGDVILIPPVGPQVAVLGSVKVPAIYELVPGESASQVLEDAGGISAVASGTRISIERTENRQVRHAMEISYDEASLKTPLSDGDVLRVNPIVPEYSDTVTLRGNLANPGRFAWHPGMRISDLIPNRESLVTRGYWWKRMQLGLPAPEFEPITGLQEIQQPADDNTLMLKQPNQENTDSPQGPRRLSAQQRGSNSTLGEQQESLPEVPTAQQTRVRLLAPDIDWDYATIERIDPITLKTSLIPFDLGKVVLEHDTSQDVELKSGDVVSIFSEADISVPLAQQTKLVTLDGEFVHSGVYSAKPGETLRELVARAGGITEKAYLYGSEFTRQSTRVSQQARFDEYVRGLEMSMNRSNLAIAASTSTPQDQANSVAAQGAERDIVAALSQIKATGRIVLRFKPDSGTIDSIPDVALENGDRFVVPHRPAIINVVGAVYNQNSFLYGQSQTLSAYLTEAGGPNKDADWRREFVIRANGDVISRDNKGAWSNSFAKLRMYPGDSIVVPNKTFKPSILKGALDWTQLFSQMGLGVAAISVIK